MIIIDKTLVTVHNIDTLKDQATCRDQAADITVGETIKLLRSTINGYNVDTMIYYGSGQAAQAQGGDSIWGDYDAETETLTDDDGNTYTLDGDIVEADSE